MENKFFMHRIKEENGVFDKGIEVHDTFNSAIQSFHAYMAYGFDNPKFPNVTFVSCKITDRSGKVLKPYDDVYQKKEAEPEPEPEEVVSE